MNKIKRSYLYLTTPTKNFENALQTISKGDTIVIEKHLPCFIWENKFEIKEVQHKRFFLVGINKLWFYDTGESNIPGVEIISIKSKGRKIRKYPSNFIYFYGPYLIFLLIIIIIFIFHKYN